MELFALLGTVLAAVIGGIATNYANNRNVKNAEQMQKDAQDYNAQQAVMANNRALSNYWSTQSPEAQVRQLQDAGLSVSLMYGGSGAGGVGQTPSASVSQGSVPVVQPLVGDLMEKLVENAKGLAEKGNKDADTDKKKAEIDKIKSDIDVNSTTIDKMISEMNLNNVRVQNEAYEGQIRQIDLEVAKATKDNQIKIVAEGLKKLENENSLLLKEIEKAGIDIKNSQAMYDAQLKKFSAETVLLWKQSAQTEAETWLANAKTALSAQEMKMGYVERQIAWKELEKAEATINQINASTKEIEQRTGKIKLEKVTEVIGWMEKLSGLINDQVDRGTKVLKTINPVKNPLKH